MYVPRVISEDECPSSAWVVPIGAPVESSMLSSAWPSNISEGPLDIRFACAGASSCSAGTSVNLTTDRAHCKMALWVGHSPRGVMSTTATVTFLHYSDTRQIQVHHASAAN